jgi:hypothetical protein
MIFLCTEEAQIGLEKALRCSNADFVVRSPIHYFDERGSSVYAAALDIRKAYDTVHQI